MIDLRRPTELLRSPVVRTKPGKIDVDGGMFGAGLIEDVAIITVGEALGHGFWIDQEFVDSVSLAMKRAGDSGIKSRFTHPDMSGDGLGKHLGKATGSRTDNDVARGDLHLTKTSHKSPSGNLAEYVMSLAEESPEDFGMSIVFERDRGATDRHRAKYTDKDGKFQSPDKRNTNNLPHVRLAVLHGVDAVDEPAANPSGMFHRGPITEFDAVAAYALGLRADAPECEQFNIHPDRVKRFLTDFLAREGLSIVKTNQRRALRLNRRVTVNID